MKKLIGICGYAGTGKDTIASYLIEYKNFSKDSFAGPLKDAVSSIFGWDRGLLEGITDKSRTFRETKDEYWSAVLGREITPRYMLQFFGTEICRDNLHKNIWIESFKRRFTDSINDTVIADIRFINEAQAIKEMGGYILCIKRDNIQQKYSHASEADIEIIGQHYANYTIGNFGNLSTFKRNILEWYKYEFR